MHGIMREQPGQKKEKGTRFRMFQLSKEMSGLGTSLPTDPKIPIFCQSPGVPALARRRTFVA
jgi:hypothetical protein